MTRDVMRVLAQARPEEFDAAVDESTRDAELARAMAAPAPRTAAVAARRRIRPMWGLGLGAAAAAVALVVATTATGPGDADGGGATAEGTRTPGARPGGEASPVRLSARTVLLSAAAGADRATAGTGDYWHLSTLNRRHEYVGDGADGYVITVRDSAESWTPAEPGRKIWARDRYLGARPATPADRAAWRRAGSPTSFTIRKAIRPDGGIHKLADLTVAPGKPKVSSDAPVDGDKVFWLGRNVSVRDLRDLPDDPGKLRAELLKWYDGHDTESLSTPMAEDDWLFRVAGGMMTGMPVPPKVRAAAFRMLAQLRSIKAVGPVRDDRGRTGAALVSVERTENGVLEHRLVIDQARGLPLSSEIILVKPGGLNARLRPGSIIHSSTIAAEWTDSRPR